MWLDFDARVVGIASQPFRLSWTTVAGRVRSHVPDYFARRTDGSAVVVDCRPVDRRPAQDVAAFEVTRRVCDLLGWRYRLVGAVNVIATANLRWLAGYRHPRHGMAGLTEALRVAFPGPTPLMSGAEAVGDPIAVLPVLFHLLWRHELVTDLSVPLHPDATVTSVVAAWKASRYTRCSALVTGSASTAANTRCSRWRVPRSGCVSGPVPSRWCWRPIWWRHRISPCWIAPRWRRQWSRSGCWTVCPTRRWRKHGAGNGTWWRWRPACHRIPSPVPHPGRGMTRRPARWRSAPRRRPPSWG